MRGGSIGPAVVVTPVAEQRGRFRVGFEVLLPLGCQQGMERSDARGGARARRRDSCSHERGQRDAARQVATQPHNKPPPSTSITAPVTNPFVMAKRYASASSRGVPARSTGRPFDAFAITAAWPADPASPHRRVSVTPGLTTLTRRGANSLARWRPAASMAALTAPFARLPTPYFRETCPEVSVMEARGNK